MYWVGLHRSIELIWLTTRLSSYNSFSTTQTDILSIILILSLLLVGWLAVGFGHGAAATVVTRGADTLRERAGAGQRAKAGNAVEPQNVKFPACKKGHDIHNKQQQITSS